MTWEQRFSALAELYGAEWAAELERLEQDWLAAYTATFVEIAIPRLAARRRCDMAGRDCRGGIHRSLPL